MFFGTLNFKINKRLTWASETLLVITVALAFAGGIFAKLSLKTLPTSGAAFTDRVVILDAGHGGEDSGAIGVSGVLEKDLNLTIVKTLGEMFENEGYQVIYTRLEDKLLYKPEENIKGIRKISDLKNRCKIAAENPSALFVSIHMNSFGMEKYSGLQVYSSIDDESRKLAECIQSSVVERLQPDNNRIVKEGKDIYILENVENTSVLIECGFLSNRRECENLSQKEYQKRLCFAIFCGIIEYMK